LPNRDHYVLHRDDIGNIQQIITPKQLKHRLVNIKSLNSMRLLYYPPEFKSPFVWNYNEYGQLTQKIYPSNYRIVNYIRDDSGEINKIIWDQNSIEFDKQTFSNENKLLFKIVVTTSRYRQKTQKTFITNLLTDVVNKIEAGRLVNSQFKYNYDSNRRLTELHASISNNEYKSSIFIKYSKNDKRFYEKINDFQFQRDTLNNNELKISDENLNLHLKQNDLAYLSELNVKIKNIQRFKASYEYDDKSRLKSFSYSINENLFDETNLAFIKEKTYSYNYDANDRLLQVITTKSDLKKSLKTNFDDLENAEKLWQIYYDSHGNAILEDSKSLNKNKNVKQLNINLQINGADQLMILDRENSKIRYKYDVDGFTYKRIDSNEETIFLFDSNQHLTKAKINSNNNKTVEYFYDYQNRLVARKHYTGYIIQYYYADESRPHLVTHIYDQNTRQLLTYYYTDDESSRLFAVDRNNVMFYIITDLLNSPLIVYDSFGNLVNQYIYDPFGNELNIDSSTTSPNGKFQLYLSFKSGICDQEAGILFLNGGIKTYDPKSGRYLAPNIDKIEDILLNPTNINLYQAFSPRPFSDEREIYFKGKFIKKAIFNCLI